MGHQPFAEAGHDTFILATSKGNMLWTCDNTVIHPLLTLHPKMEVPVELMKFWDVWGPIINSVSGDEWKAPRRAITAGFGNAMNNIVWNETPRQTKTLATYWITRKGSAIPIIRYWTFILALHVLSSSFLGAKDSSGKIMEPVENCHLDIK